MSYLKIIPFIVSVVTHSLSVILNTLGICTLWNLKHDLTNQRIFLLNLSICELLYTSVTLGYYAISVFSDNDESVVFSISRRLSWICYYLYLISPLVLTIDRLFFIAFPWKYKAFSTKTKAILLVCSTWICVLLIALPCLLITDYETARKNHLSAVALGIEVTVVSFAIVAYTFIGLKVNSHSKSVGRTKFQAKILKIAIIIIITYFFLEAVPSMVLTVLFRCCSDVAQAYRRLLYVPSGFNTVCDPIVYLYNYPPLKEAVNKKLRRMTTRIGFHQQRSSTRASTEDVSRPYYLSDQPV